MSSESLQIFKINFSIKIFNRSLSMRARNFGEDTLILLSLTFGTFTVMILVRIFVLCGSHIALSDQLHTKVMKHLSVIF